MKKTYLLFLVFVTGNVFAQTTPVNTESREIQYQERKIFYVSNVYFSNDFPGARLNEIAEVNDTLVRITIKPENTPINPSPWYAFKVWSETEQDLTIHLKYEDGLQRYYPKVSMDGKHWSPLDSSRLTWDPTEVPRRFQAQTGDSIEFRTQAYIKINTSPDTTWIAAQEVITSKDNEIWVDEINRYDFVEKEFIGTTPLDVPIWKMDIGNTNSEKAILVFSRQHPPEVTGYLAMRTFVEEITGDSKLAIKFRDEYHIIVFPMVNPDGVDEGHWRHNTGGVDLNRDWANLNQPETNLISGYLQNYLHDTGTRVYFGIDFHSTWKDIFYVLNRTAEVTQVTKQWLAGMEYLLPGFRVVEREVPLEGAGTSVRWFYKQAGSDGVTYEVGDDTNRNYLKEKAKAAAISLMTVMLDMN